MIDILATGEFALSAYEALLPRSATNSDTLPAARVPGRTDAFFALDNQLNFYLLIQVAAEVVVPEKRLDAIRISAGSRFAVSEGQGSAVVDQPFASVILAANHLPLLTSFGYLAGILLASLPERPSQPQLATFLDDFLGLFAPRNIAGRDDVLGLWGELWVMTQAPIADAMMRGWHLSTVDKFDFSFEQLRLEVKTTERSSRVHTFTLEQIESQTKPTWIASVQVLPDPAGASVTDLIAQLISTVSRDLHSDLARKCLATLSGDIEAAADYRFAPSGIHPLAIVDARSVPRVLVPPGAPISSVRFSVDISLQASQASMTLADLLN